MVSFRSFEYQNARRFVCTKLGVRYDGSGQLYSHIGNDFYVNLQVIEALYQYPNWSGQINSLVLDILKDSEVDLGIRWRDGQFSPSGSPLLDEKLVNEVLGHLSSKKLEGVMKPFQKGLNHFLHSMKKPDLLTDVITDMYEALEAAAKIVTERDKEFSRLGGQ